MKYLQVYAWLLVLTFGTSYGQNRTNAKKERIHIYSKYQYPDSSGANLIVENSFPKSGIKYIAPNGEKRVYAVFWTRLINETLNSFELKIHFPLDSFELSSSPGNHIKLLIPSDTMTLNKEAMFDYGLAVKSFLDKDRHKSSPLKRTINPKESSGFYVVTLSNHGVNGTLRTELYIKEQSLFYRINGKEIYCGEIKLIKNSS